MASQNLNTGSIHSSDCTEKIGIAGERDVGRSHVKTDSPRSSRKTEEKEESFMASDLFFQKMGTMINKQDVQSILDKQTETLTKFEKTNAKFGKFNDLSAARYLHLNQQLKNHTKMLLDMKKDLDSVFRRIRNLKTKLTKQYGPAFHATSAGIQKLEEELGASIENEDSASLSTLTESKELSCDSQSTNPGLALRNEGIAQQKIEEDMSQSTDLSIENKSAATTETEIQLQGNDKSILVSSAQVNEVMNRTEETEDVIRTAETTDMNWTEDTDDTVQTEDTSCKTETVDTDNTYQAVDESDQTETVDTDNTYRTVETSDTIQTVDTSDMYQTQGSGYPSGTDTHDMTECKDINDMERTVDTSDVTRTVDGSDKSQSEDTNDVSQTLETSELSEGDSRNK